MYERVSPEQEQAVSNVLSSRHKTNYQYEVQQLVPCPEASPEPVPASGMCTAVNTSSHLHGILIRCLRVMLVHLKQANLPFLDFNAITAPLMYIKDQLASRITLDQHGVALIAMRLVGKMWKF